METPMRMIREHEELCLPVHNGIRIVLRNLRTKAGLDVLIDHLLVILLTIDVYAFLPQGPVAAAYIQLDLGRLERPGNAAGQTVTPLETVNQYLLPEVVGIRADRIRNDRRLMGDFRLNCPRLSGTEIADRSPQACQLQIRNTAFRRFLAEFYTAPIR